MMIAAVAVRWSCCYLGQEEAAPPQVARVSKKSRGESTILDSSDNHVGLGG